MCFVFKPKTAYEMRISDWSSDVCSSDLYGRLGSDSARKFSRKLHNQPGIWPRHGTAWSGKHRQHIFDHRFSFNTPAFVRAIQGGWNITSNRPGKAWRSEEHTSELQSLMRISYAVFCLKKKNKINKT